MDVIGDAVAAMRAGRPVSARLDWRGPWGQRFASVQGAAGVQVVLRGQPWLIRDDGPPLRLSAGDVLLMPRGHGYALADSPSTPLQPCTSPPGPPNARTAANRVSPSNGGTAANRTGTSNSGAAPNKASTPNAGMTANRTGPSNSGTAPNKASTSNAGAAANKAGRSESGTAVNEASASGAGAADSAGSFDAEAAADKAGVRVVTPRDGAVLCGAYELEPARMHPLMDDLPELVHLPAHLERNPRLRSVVDLLAAELEGPEARAAAGVPALLELMFLYVLRDWLTVSTDHGGWAAALRDPAVGAALRAIHLEPGREWSVAGLAAVGGLSRAAFARRFTVLVGRAPLAYVGWWRMTVAARMLRESDEPLRVVARRVGYASEFAFAAAFKRRFGTAPGRFRHEPSPEPTRSPELTRSPS